MRHTIARAVALTSLVLAVAAVGPVSLQAHEGHDHGAPPPPVSNAISPRTEASSGEVELVAVARGGELTIHVDHFRTNAPIANGEIEIDSPAGILKPSAVGEGVWMVKAPFLSTPGSHDLAFTITFDGTVDILAATLVVPRAIGPNDGSTSADSWLGISARAQEMSRHITGSGFGLWLGLAVGFAGGMLVARRGRARKLIATSATALAIGLLTVPAPTRAETAPAPVSRDIAQRFPDGAIFVPKPTQRILGIRTHFTQERRHRRAVELPGRVIPSPNASGLVQASVGGRLSPPDGGFKPLGTSVKTGDVLAYVHPPLPLADATAQQQQARELDQQISIVGRKVDRLRSIERIIARSQLEEAELELKGLQTRRANLERVQREPEPLVAPVTGVIASSNAVAGQMAEPNAIIFQIVDPNVLWVEALSYEPRSIDGAARAVASEGRTLELAYVGAGLSDRNQAVPIHFSIRGDVTGLRAGQFVTVLASTTEEHRGLTLPREAVLRGSNGQSLVYEHTAAERFVAREVRIEPLDGTNVLVVAGIESGRRIVTQGAELLNQIR